MTFVTLFLAMLATARITRLITTDRITQAPRGWILRKLDPEGLMAYLVVCDWCSSVYVGAAVGTAWALWGNTTAFAAVTAALACSYVAGFLASKESD